MLAAPEWLLKIGLAAKTTITWQDQGYNATVLTISLLASLKYPAITLSCYAAWLYVQIFYSQSCTLSTEVQLSSAILWPHTPASLIHKFKLLHANLKTTLAIIKSFNAQSITKFTFIATFIVLVLTAYFGITQVLVSCAIVVIFINGPSKDAIRSTVHGLFLAAALILLYTCRSAWWFNLYWKHNVLVWTASDVIERQRWWMGIGWQAELLSTDPPLFSVPGGKTVTPNFKSYVTKLTSLANTSESSIVDMSSQWMYASAFYGSSQSVYPKFDSVVRERVHFVQIKFDLRQPNWDAIARVLGTMLLDI